MNDHQSNTLTFGTSSTPEKSCGCGPDCNCGPDCPCGENGSCAPACTCGG
jgi:hypothetical protein